MNEHDEDEDITEEVPQPTGPRKPVEAWAAAKGYTPQFLGGTAPRATPTRERVARLVPGMGPRLNPEFWKFAAARSLCCWVDGQELTEAEFDDAILRACNQRIG